MKRRILVALLAVTSSACVTDIRDRKVALFDEPKSVTVEVPTGAPIWLRVPAGDVMVEQASGSALAAELVVMCPSLDSRCAKGMRNLELIAETNADGVHLALNKNRAFSYRNSDLIIRIAIPAEHPVHIDVTAGDVDIDVANCTEVNMEAGDLTLIVPERTVRSVSIDTGVGDATLRRQGERLSGRRALLVGAEVDWQQGPGDCDIVVDLQAGDAKVELG